MHTSLVCSRQVVCMYSLVICCVPYFVNYWWTVDVYAHGTYVLSVAVALTTTFICSKQYPAALFDNILGKLSLSWFSCGISYCLVCAL